MKKTIKFALIFALLAGIYYGYGIYDKKPKEEYIISKAIKKDLVKTIDSNGEIHATELIDVGAQVSGQIKKLYVKLGDLVKQGDIIAQIDSATQQNSVNTKLAQLQTYEAKLQSAKIALEISKNKFKRASELFKKNAISKEVYEDAKNTLAINEANLKEFNSLIAQTKIQLNTAQIDLGYTLIKAPKAGVVVSVRVEEGQTVNSNQTTPTIVNIADLNHLQLKMEIAEGDITKVKTGQSVEFSIFSEPNKKFKTTISSIDPALTTLSDGKYTSTTTSSSSSSNAVYYYAKADIENIDGIFRIGMTTQNKIVLEVAKDAIIAPIIALKNENGKNVVYVLQNGKPEKREIVIGLVDSLRFQILSGVEEGENIITSSGNSAEIDAMLDEEAKKMGMK
ncbi:MAG: efflux RND transporter periplasmic adaptor subunit [Campylobacter sp.]